MSHKEYKNKKSKEKINIEDLSKLKITKIADFRIYFNYDGKHYMLIENRDDDAVISLYEREISDKGFVKTRCMQSEIAYRMDIESFIKDISAKNKSGHIVYANIDKEYFVKQLMKIGYADSLFEEQYKEMIDKMIDKKRKTMEKIFKLEQELQSLRRDLNTIEKEFMEHDKHK